MSRKSDMREFLASISEISDIRAKRCAALINSLNVENVHEYGCGLMQLKNYISENKKYFGYDTYKFSKDVILFDISNQHLVYKNDSISVLLGKLEGLENIVDILLKVINSHDYTIFSYTASVSRPFTPDTFIKSNNIKLISKDIPNTKSKNSIIYLVEKL